MSRVPQIGIREDGTVEGYEVETFYIPCTAISDDTGFLRVVMDDVATDAETRISHSTLLAAGWIKKDATPSQVKGSSAASAEPELSDEQLIAAIEAALPLLDKEGRRAMTYTRWHDGIDCDYLTVHCRGFIAGVLLNLEDARATATQGAPREGLRDVADDAAYRLADLLDDTQHKDHDCGEGGCPVRAARESLGRLRAALDATQSGPSKEGGE